MCLQTPEEGYEYLWLGAGLGKNTNTSDRIQMGSALLAVDEIKSMGALLGQLGHCRACLMLFLVQNPAVTDGGIYLEIRKISSCLNHINLYTSFCSMSY